MPLIKAKKSKTKNKWVGKVIFWELCKSIWPYEKKSYMHNPEFVPKNETNKLICDFEKKSNLGQTYRL